MQHVSKSITWAVCAVAMIGLSPLTLQAQDHPDEHRDQRPDEHRDDHPAPAQTEHRDDQHGDADRYRHDHPHASARCHDGFFTTTRDRARACRKHGGIDVWLVL